MKFRLTNHTHGLNWLDLVYPCSMTAIYPYSPTPCLTSTAQLLLWRELVPAVELVAAAETPTPRVNARHSSAAAIVRKHTLHAFSTTTELPIINDTRALSLPDIIKPVPDRGRWRWTAVGSHPRSHSLSGDDSFLSPGFQTELWFSSYLFRRMRSKS